MDRGKEKGERGKEKRQQPPLAEYAYMGMPDETEFGFVENSVSF
jgi:hypothetical protein